jgi:hypothetical protein
MCPPLGARCGIALRQAVDEPLCPVREQPNVAREIQVLSKSDIFLYVERREYLAALHRMRGGLEDARIALAKARQRLNCYP